MSVNLILEPGAMIRDAWESLGPIYLPIVLLNLPVVVLNLVIANTSGWGALLLQFLVGPIVGGATVILIHRYLRGSQINIGESLAGAWRKASALIVTNFLVFIICTVGSILILPGIYLAIRLFASQYEVAIEGQSPIEALGSSWKLTKGHWWTIFLTLLFTVFVLLIPMFIVGFIVNATIPQFSNVVIQIAALFLLPPFVMVGLSIYRDLK